MFEEWREEEREEEREEDTEEELLLPPVMAAGGKQA